MSGKKFTDVFGKIPFSDTVLETLGDSFVRLVKISKEEKTMFVNLEPPEIIDETIAKAFKAEALKELPYINDVGLEFYYGEKARENGFIDEYWSNILLYTSLSGPFARAVMDEAEYSCDSGKLTISLRHNGSFFMYKSGMDRLIEEKLRRAGADFKVVFKDIRLSEDEAGKLAERKERLAEKAVFEAQISDTPGNMAKETALPSGKNGAAPDNGCIILGKDINSPAMDISEARTDGEKAVVRGYVFNVDVFGIKGDRYIVSFDMTDFTDSTTVKFFTDRTSYDRTASRLLKEGAYVAVRGEIQFDKYNRELVIMARDINKLPEPEPRMDNSPEKRVELHLHTQMSSMDGVTPVSSYIKRAAKWGHKAIAVTDHGVVQAFPDAVAEAQKSGIKVIYGVEAYFVDDLGEAVKNPAGQSLMDSYVVFDIETTGLTAGYDKITEIGAVKIINGKIGERYSTFINPGIPLPHEIVKLTGITDDMLCGAPDISKELPIRRRLRACCA